MVNLQNYPIATKKPARRGFCLLSVTILSNSIFVAFLVTFQLHIMKSDVAAFEAKLATYAATHNTEAPFDLTAN